MDKINKVKLEILFNIGKSLTKARNLLNFNLTIFEGLFIVIVMENFYPFLPITGCLL